MSNDQLSWNNIFGDENAAQAEGSVATTALSKPLTQAPAPVSSRGTRSESKAEAQPKTKPENKPETPSVTQAKSGPSGGKSPTVNGRAPAERPLSSFDWTPLAVPTGGSSGGSSDDANPMKSLVKPLAAPVAPASSRLLSSSADDVDDGLEAPDGSPQVLSVNELNKQIRSTLEGKFPLIWVKGEISNFKAHTSGHFYFSLKDAKAQVSAVMFRGFNQQLKFRPEDGMEVIVRGRVTVYEPRGNYQMFCEMMEPVGAGALQKAFEQLKAKLQGEGLFEPARKRPLPALPKHIAIVTSPTGAAIRDMLNVLGRRFKGLRITVIPTKVQGAQAASEIVSAIELAGRLADVDAMIVGRGGGSIEDMWCFNDERVARAIAATRVPVISAVGHEIDFTIADFVADLRAPTPSAAAELVVKNAGDLQARIETLSRSLKVNIARAFESARKSVESFAKRLIDPQRRIQDCVLRSDELTQRLEAALLRNLQSRRMGIALLREKLGSPEGRIASERQKVDALARRLTIGVHTRHVNLAQTVAARMALLDSLSPLRVVERGYSLVTLNEQVVNSVDQIRTGEVVCIQFAHGRASAKIERIENKKGVTDRESSGWISKKS